VRNFQQIAAGVECTPLLLELIRQPELWNRNKARLSPNGPHYQTDDIWLRYKDERENILGGDYRNFGDPHDGVWYPSYYALPAAKPLIFGLMHSVCAERLGGVLIYRIPPGKQILSHTDTGWHVEYYDKFNIYLQAEPSCAFRYKDGEEIRAKTGDVYYFINDVPHEVINEGAQDHIVLTVCVRIDKGGRSCLSDG
jgi:Aspartyl/Asparaginyl beta-hydroxylase